MTNPALVVLPADELKTMITDAVRAALEPLSAAEPARYLDTREAASLLQIHPDTLSRMVRRGLVPSTRVGREYRFRREDLVGIPNSSAATGHGGRLGRRKGSR